MAWPSPRWGHQPAGRQRRHLAGLRVALQGWDRGALVTAPSAGGCTLIWPRGHRYLLWLLCWGHPHLPVPVLLCPPCLWPLEHPRSCWGALGLQGWPWGARGSHLWPGAHGEGWAPGRGGWGTHVWKSRSCSPGNRRGEGVGGPSTAPAALPSLPPALTWQVVPVAGDAAHGQQRHRSGHQHPRHRCPCHCGECLEGRLGWKRAATCQPIPARGN